mmetsp:Transcript_18094/g.54573  ORF Transcript_18094/g.54573 Transcript_18094/m.54573 type:complete len:103 (-) Transcript_18094:317-625(-)
MGQNVNGSKAQILPKLHAQATLCKTAAVARCVHSHGIEVAPIKHALSRVVICSAEAALNPNCVGVPHRHGSDANALSVGLLRSFVRSASFSLQAKQQQTRLS